MLPGGIRNAHEINLATGEGFMLVFKAQQQAHSRLRNCCCNEEDEYKDKLVVEVIRARSLAQTRRKYIPVGSLRNPCLRRPELSNRSPSPADTNSLYY